MQPEVKRHNETSKNEVPSLTEYIFERLSEDKLVLARNKEEAVIKVLTRELEIDPRILGVRLVKETDDYILVLKRSGMMMRINVKQKINDEGKRENKGKLFIVSFQPLEKGLLAKNHRTSSVL